MIRNSVAPAILIVLFELAMAIPLSMFAVAILFDLLEVAALVPVMMGYLWLPVSINALRWVAYPNDSSVYLFSCCCCRSY